MFFSYLLCHLSKEGVCISCVKQETLTPPENLLLDLVPMHNHGPYHMCLALT